MTSVTATFELEYQGFITVSTHKLPDGGERLLVMHEGPGQEDESFSITFTDAMRLVQALNYVIPDYIRRNP